MKLFSDPPYTILSMSGAIPFLRPKKLATISVRFRGHGLTLPELQFQYLR